MVHASVRAGAVAGGPDQIHLALKDAYLAQSNTRGGYVGDAESFLVDARGLLPFALTVMKAVAADPRAAETLLV